ncbi:MAG: cell division protein FtsA [Candidatus Vogelbacteria bacterium RIFOXYD1_FULL_44_32]|uniref:Cell division protein FtsA n=1 Tax=Candidatus Vogelbacteria bacterium RIFOXYD1_FULL_44_32 TaxID=1802438 RepID=A0A1G2QD62_9BACT|nr:MAG: cell division protein FtsA [Candidatus Vogelbacteria bacterium RIFOXYD1_FULL_44_32]
MTRNIVTGLDIGTASIRVVVCEYKNGSQVPQVIALVKKNSRGLRRGYILQFDEATASIKEAVQEAERIAGFKIKSVILGVSGATLESRIIEGGVVVSRADSEINANDINRAIEATEGGLPDTANKSIIHRVPIAFKLDGKKVTGRPEGLKGARLDAQVLFVTYASNHLKDLLSATESAGVKVEDVAASPLAASLCLTTKLQKTAGCVLANIGSQTTSIIIFEEGLPISIRVFPIGSTDITNDIALGFQIPLEEAEKIKTGEVDANTPLKKLNEIIEARLSDIFEFIENHLKRLGRNGLLPAGIIITGGGSGISEIESLAKDYFKLPAKVALPAVSTSSRNQIRDTAWSVAYGLCIFGADSEVEESMGLKIARETKYNIIRWIKELLP